MHKKNIPQLLIVTINNKLYNRLHCRLAFRKLFQRPLSRDILDQVTHTKADY